MSFVIPVYKNEYTNYAELCDSKADQTKKDALAHSIKQKYSASFETMYADLLNMGKTFVAQNKINVDWKENTNLII
ncbi:hypothetical protein [Chryseobacterium gregarium]|uniref:hypothetical protein n=1 Tax=Chryseobacterium gregarium TaxID=456299 RepID=UPI0012DD18CB|nr:hypothetical protein [Chryseobacterium gregarium]